MCHKKSKEVSVGVLLKRDADFFFKNSRYLKELLKSSENKLDLFAFSPADVKKNHIEGYTFKTHWIKSKRKYPDVIYDLSLFAKSENLKADKIRHKLSETCRFINPLESIPRSYDKLLFSKIMQNSNLPHPETKKLNNNSLNLMLKKFNNVVVKPRWGCRGNNIIFTSKKIPVKKDYIVQEAIDVITSKCLPMYFRVLIQRNFQGKLVPLSIGARRGHPCQGGDFISYRIQAKSKKRLINLALKTAKALEGTNKIGEVGVDLVLDRNNKAWVIETNLKTGHMLPHRKKMVKNIIRYMEYLGKK